MKTAHAESEQQFLQSVARHRVTTYDGNTWEYYDHGKQDEKIHGSPPLVFLPGINGTAKCFHLQMTALAKKGYRVLSIQYPVVWTHEEWIHSFDRLLDNLNLPQIHIYGVSLGAYLAQRYAAQYPHRVISLALTQGFTNLSVFSANAPYVKMIAFMPDFYLKKIILEQFPRGEQRSEALVSAIDYMVDQLNSLSQRELASRLTLSCLPCDPNSWKVALPDHKLTLIDSYQDSLNLQEQMTNRYPDAKKAMIKSAGAFPFLSHHEDVTMHLQVHLRGQGLFLP